MGGPDAVAVGVHDAIFAALGSGSHSRRDEQLCDKLPENLLVIERALQVLFGDRGELGRNLADWFTGPEVLRGVVAAVAAFVSAEVIQRERRRSRSTPQVPAVDGDPASLRLFPELFGLPPGVKP
jgi:hypothetical protein